MTVPQACHRAVTNGENGACCKRDRTIFTDWTGDNGSGRTALTGDNGYGPAEESVENGNMGKKTQNRYNGETYPHPQDTCFL